MSFIKLLIGFISIILSGVFGWFFIGKIKQSAFIAKTLRDSALLTNFIGHLGINKIAMNGAKLQIKGDSFRNNLDDVVSINTFASRSLTFLYGGLAAVGVLSGMLISKYFFLADISTFTVVAFLKMPVQFALQAAREIEQMIVILYRLRQTEPIYSAQIKRQSALR